jgi:hypothetical protein
MATSAHLGSSSSRPCKFIARSRNIIVTESYMCNESPKWPLSGTSTSGTLQSSSTNSQTNWEVDTEKKYRQCRSTDLNCCEETCRICNALEMEAQWQMVDGNDSWWSVRNWCTPLALYTILELQYTVFYLGRIRNWSLKMLLDYLDRNTLLWPRGTHGVVGPMCDWHVACTLGHRLCDGRNPSEAPLGTVAGW